MILAAALQVASPNFVNARREKSGTAAEAQLKYFVSANLFYDNLAPLGATSVSPQLR